MVEASMLTEGNGKAHWGAQRKAGPVPLDFACLCLKCQVQLMRQEAPLLSRSHLL